MRLFSLVISLLAIAATVGCSTFTPEALDYVEVDVPGSSKQKSMAYGVYTPPNWQPDERLPLIVFLHGARDSHESFERFGAHTYLDEKITAGEIGRAVIVTPNGDLGFWENWKDGSFHYRDWVLDYVMPKVQKDYNTLPCPEHCHLAGISMGGFGVMRFAYYASEQFSSISAISTPLFIKPNEADNKMPLFARLFFPFKRMFGEFTEETKISSAYYVWQHNDQVKALRLQLLRGDKESTSIAQGNDAFHAHLNNNGIKHDYFVYAGGHKWKYWVPNLDRVMNFLLGDD